ncbi:3-dehydroquinate synthase [Mucisphaera calidilacus]|uniref:3-dehydroquinate synthase n=1 Tax=Mucisphaera calidilacus TaxID=2527982 RepID=A0A518BZV8_9BACT|nr:3-dehydroquinate synthase [Mucisphaera calidilacus]QDU72501.1 3-dehydroquinate synthase [Mucisphaera calidilacus]
MATVDLQLPPTAHGYDIRIEPGLLDSLGEMVREVAPHHKAALIVDEAIEVDVGKPAAKSLQNEGFETTVAVMTPTEKKKTLGTVRSLYEVLLEARIERRSPVIALGGGITGDTAGFVAASYLRGVPFIQCPTTLLAMVDASVGGKTGVNTTHGKNLIGAFHQPHRVIIDVSTLESLPERELRCGLAECVKHGVIRDPGLFTWIGEHADRILQLDHGTLVELVERNVRIKAAVVEEDEKESGVRAHLNFGHTFAHAIEAASAYGRIKHGEAVALGMVAATRMAIAMKICHPSLEHQVVDLLEALGLPTWEDDLPVTALLMKVMAIDKKVADSRIRFVLPTKLGEVIITSDPTPELVAEAWDSLRVDPRA